MIISMSFSLYPVSHRISGLRSLADRGPGSVQFSSLRESLPSRGQEKPPSGGVWVRFRGQPPPARCSRIYRQGDPLPACSSRFLAARRIIKNETIGMNGSRRPRSTTDQWMYKPINTRNRLMAKLRYHVPTFECSIK